MKTTWKSKLADVLGTLGKWKKMMMKMKNKKWSLEAKNGLRELVVEWKWIFWIRTLIWKGQKWDISEKLPKMAKNIFWDCLVKSGNLSNLANCIQNIVFYMVFCSWCSKSHIRNSKKRVIRKFRPHPPKIIWKPYKIIWKPYKII